ncbi:MAG: CDP-glucose 4,6-dehydratase [Geminicoccaceae bacterium]|nr:CDP-glucose 4,6-dehydratase [Geminicoccaceae bacterium]
MNNIDRTFWLNRRVLVTGHTGFKGTWLAAWLTDLGADVIGFAQPPTHAAPLHRAAALGERMTHFVGDVRDRESLAAVVAEQDPEIVFHLAAQPLVLPGLKDPLHTFDVNVQGTLNLLEAARRSRDLRAVVVVTSDKCYRQTSGFCTEDDHLGGHDPYSASKACAEMIAHTYRHCYLTAEDGVGLATARAGNVIGAGDMSADRLLPDLVRAAAAGRPVELRHPDAVRPWQHVLDALHGYILLAQAVATDPQGRSGAWNFGPSSTSHWTVRRVAERICAALGGRLDIRPPAQSVEAPILRLDAGKAARDLGWRSALDIETTIDWTLEGYARLLDPSAGVTTAGASWLYRQIERLERRAAALCTATSGARREDVHAGHTA